MTQPPVKPHVNARTISELLAPLDGDASALGAPNRSDLSFDGLRELIARTGEQLNSFGLGREDGIAIVLPNGAEMAAAFLGVANAATAAPLNPGYRTDEFEFYLADLDARAVVVQEGVDSPVREVTGKLGIPLIELQPDADGPAGSFTLSAEIGGSAERPGEAGADDVGLVLHTSGTTSRPKIVPLRQRNLIATAHHIRDTLQLTSEDRCLNIMPLFHIHGIMAGILASVGAGGSTWCSPGFNAMQVFGWLRESTPSWYTAVPTMHQLILTRASRNADALDETDLRLIRSSSSSLPPTVMAELEDTFGAPVIESYGMTEAAHQMSSNPLPPQERKPGSVGLPAGPEIAIMDEDGALLAMGQRGEVVIRGPNVTDGYRNNPEANATAYTRGWFRTGDQGVLDGDGYLTITGRLKEIINRGGEKISPREVDEALLQHPAVAQAVTFAMPHDRLGEEIAAAVVLRDGEDSDERAIRRFVGERIADFKTPRRIVILDEIPKGATGKVQRIGLAEKLGLAE
ncbi:MAG: AMP-binding protein [Chloroflexi bacterium]|nr:AMP-binding protein [Chloroflexota bacterium]MYD16431.1 AMP-binding protein [Chloroflexota bacterium]MYJ02680.1 AMP-binding protein [Chloroflexota bacterium]